MLTDSIPLLREMMKDWTLVPKSEDDALGLLLLAAKLYDDAYKSGRLPTGLPPMFRLDFNMKGPLCGSTQLHLFVVVGLLHPDFGLKKLPRLPSVQEAERLARGAINAACKKALSECRTRDRAKELRESFRKTLTSTFKSPDITSDVQALLLVSRCARLLKMRRVSNRMHYLEYVEPAETNSIRSPLVALTNKALRDQLLTRVVHAEWRPAIDPVNSWAVRDEFLVRTTKDFGLLLKLGPRGRPWLNAWMKSKSRRAPRGVSARKSLATWVGGKEATLAVVYTDIVGSTALANRLGDELMKQVRRRHFKQVRALISAYDGWEIKNKGDGFILAFRTAVNALKFVLALRSDPGHADIKIRAGVHLGLVDVDPVENDTFCQDMNFAARIEGEAGNSICLSADSMSQVAAHREGDLCRLRWKRRRVRLKGFDGKYTVHVLR